MQPIQMQLPQKHKAVFPISFPLSKSPLTFKHFQKKDDAHS